MSDLDSFEAVFPAWLRDLAAGQYRLAGIVDAERRESVRQALRRRGIELSGRTLLADGREG